MPSTKVTSKYLTSVPSEIRKRFSIEPGDALEWIAIDQEVIIKPRKTKKTGDPLLELIGLVNDEPTDVTRDHNKLLYGKR